MGRGTAVGGGGVSDLQTCASLDRRGPSTIFDDPPPHAAHREDFLSRLLLAVPRHDLRTRSQQRLDRRQHRQADAQRAGIHDVPVLIRDLTDGEALEIALIENIQRSDLNALEEARAYALLLEQFSYTQQQLADSIGKSRSHIANTLRLMNLPEAVRAEIEQGRLTAGHARALVATDSPAELAAKIIKLGLSVREAENLAREAASPRKPRAKLEKDADTRALEKLVSEAIGLKLEITHKGDGSGTMLITYKTLDQLEDVCRRLQK